MMDKKNVLKDNKERLQKNCEISDIVQNSPTPSPPPWNSDMKSSDKSPMGWPPPSPTLIVTCKKFSLINKRSNSANITNNV